MWTEHTHARSPRASCSELVFYQDHVGHLEPINTTPKVQTLDQRASPHTKPLAWEGARSLTGAQPHANIYQTLDGPEAALVSGLRRFCGRFKKQKPDSERPTSLEVYVRWYGFIS